jgi:hypothetical protein
MDDAALRARVEAIIESKVDWLPSVDLGYLHARPCDLAAEIAALFAPVLAERDALIDSYITDTRPWSPGRRCPFVAFADGVREEEFADHASAVAWVRERLGLGPDHPSTT